MHSCNRRSEVKTAETLLSSAPPEKILADANDYLVCYSTSITKLLIGLLQSTYCFPMYAHSVVPAGDSVIEY